MKHLLLTLSLGLFSVQAHAVAVYHPPCEKEQERDDKDNENIRKCFEKKHSEDPKNDLAQECLEAYESSAKSFQQSKDCQRKASFF